MDRNTQALSGAAYETKVERILEQRGYTVNRLDFGNYMPDYIVLDSKGKAAYLELKNYRTCNTFDLAIKKANKIELRKDVLCTKRIKMRRDQMWLMCIAYGGKNTEVI